MKQLLMHIKEWLSELSFRTGIIVLISCVIFYIISFAQMLLPVSIAAKGALWAVFFGLAKTAQYTALLIFGKEGLSRLKKWWRKENAGVEE